MPSVAIQCTRLQPRLTQRRTASSIISQLLPLSLCIILYISVCEATFTPSAIYSTVVVNKYQSAPFALQDLPLPPSLQAYATRFGCGVAITPDGNTIVALGVDTNNMRQFAQVYKRDMTTGLFTTPYDPFYGDTVTQTFLNQSTSSYTPAATCPVCVSADGSLVVMGGWLTTVFSWTTTANSSLLVARLNDGGGQYQFLTRLFTGVASGANQRLFASDMICTADLSTIVVTEVGLNQTITTVSNLYVRINSTDSAVVRGWQLQGATSYIASANDVGPRLLRLGLSGDGKTYTITQANYTLEVRSMVNGSLLQTIDLSNVTNGMPLVAATPDYDATRIVYSTQGPTFLGERYVWALEYSSQLKQYDVANVVLLVDTQNTSYVYWGAGSQLSFVPNVSIDALAAGLPNYPVKPTPSLSYLQTGTLNVWRACIIGATTTTSAFTSWLPAYSYARPFASGLPLADGLGCSYTSHNLWSSDGNLLVSSAPMGSGPGRVLLFTGLVPVCPVPPTPPPPVAPAGSWLTTANLIIACLIVVVIIAIVLINVGKK